MNRDEFELALAIVYDDIEPVATPELMAIRDSILAEFDHLTAEIARLRDAVAQEDNAVHVAKGRWNVVRKSGRRDRRGTRRKN